MKCAVGLAGFNRLAFPRDFRYPFPVSDYYKQLVVCLLRNEWFVQILRTCEGCLKFARKDEFVWLSNEMYLKNSRY